MSIISLIIASLSLKRIFSDGTFAQLGETCGGIQGIQCANHLDCFFTGDCNPDCGYSDCAGICLKPDCDPPYPLCRGFAGFPCDSDSTCLDTPGDFCSPDCEENPGADCGGTCVLNSAIGQPCDSCASLGLPCGLCPDGVNNFGFCSTCIINHKFQCVPEVLTCPPQAGDPCCGCDEPKCACTLCPDGVTYAGCCGECLIDASGECAYSGQTTCPEPLACASDSFQCPDGSYVSRDPYDDCKFRKCCCPGDRPASICWEGCACCPDGTWTGSWGDGQTFTCDGVTANINENPEFFSEQCVCEHCLDTFDHCAAQCADYRRRQPLLACMRPCFSPKR